jgi:hypothetical protein
MNCQSQLSYYYLTIILLNSFIIIFFFKFVAFVFAFTNYHHYRAFVLLPLFFVYFVMHSACCTIQWYSHNTWSQGLNNENKKIVIKLAFFFVLTGYNERLPYCCDILEPSYRPTRPPPPAPGNSTQFRGSRTLKQRHKDTDHIRPMSYFR